MKNLSELILSRLKILFFNQHLTLTEKLKLCKSFGVNANDLMKEIILAKRKYSTGNDFIEIGSRVFSIPSNASDDFLNGIAQVLGEAFIFTENFPLKPEYLQRGDFYLDIGANIGTTVMYAHKYIGSEGLIVAVEPLISDLLKENLNVNNISGVSVIEKCVLDKQGTVKMDLSESAINSKVETQKNTLSVDVEATTIDNIVEEMCLRRLDLIKMDIEGAEESAILGAVKTIKRFSPKWTIASYHNDFVGEAQHPKLVKLLKSLGYSIKEVPNKHIFAYK